jgi:hypothetical protein
LNLQTAGFDAGANAGGVAKAIRSNRFSCPRKFSGGNHATETKIMLKKETMALVAAMGVLAFGNVSASAATVFERTIIAYNSPVEWRLTCVKWASGKWPWPAKGGWKTCVGHRYETMRHDYVFVVDVGGVLAPDVQAAVRAAAESAMPTANTEAALGFAKKALASVLSQNPLTSDLLNLSVRIEHRTRWS